MSALVPYNRRNDIFGGIRDFYDTLDDFFNDSWVPVRSLAGNSFRVDVKESDNEYTIEAEMPGIKKEDIQIKLANEYLTIAVNKEENINDEKENYIHRERRVSSMSRSLHLADAKTEGVQAKLDNGILTINVGKEKKSGTINIDIS